MTIDNIKTLIIGDESRTLELKKTTGELKDGMHTVTIKRDLAFMQSAGIIKHVGSDKTGHWEVVK